MSTNPQDVESATNQQKLAEQKLQELDRDLKAAKNFIQEAPEVLKQLSKKFSDAQQETSKLSRQFKLMDEDDEQYHEEKNKLETAQREEKLIDQQLKDFNQKLEQAKLDDVRIQREIDEQSKKIELLNVQNTNTPLPNTPNPSITEAFRPRPTFHERRDRTNHTTNIESTDKSIDIIKQLKPKCDIPGSNYQYDPIKKQIELVTPTNNTIVFTKDGASTTSNDKRDLELMAKEYLDALIRDGKDLKTVYVTAQGDSKTELKEIFDKMKKEKITELETRNSNRLTQNQTLVDRQATTHVESQSTTLQTFRS
jgi:hypothetical protein